MTRYKSVTELDRFYKTKKDLPEAFAYFAVKQKLVENGFGFDLENLKGYVTNNSNILDYCYQIQQGLLKEKSVLALIDSSEILWDVHKYFPVLYAINNIGESVFRASIRDIIDSILDKEAAIQYVKKLSQNMILISNVFTGDNRLAVMAPSLEGILEPLIFTKKMVFTSYAPRSKFADAKKDAMFKLETFYSPCLGNTFSQNVLPIFIKTREEKKSLW
jgi:hypothetical protein